MFSHLVFLDQHTIKKKETIPKKLYIYKIFCFTQNAYFNFLLCMNCVLLNYSKLSSIWADHHSLALMATEHHQFLHFQIYDCYEAGTEHN